jgi:hypothetical protein
MAALPLVSLLDEMGKLGEEIRALPFHCAREAALEVLEKF